MTPTLHNLTDTAAALAITTRTLERWLARGAPKAARGRFDPEAVRAWAEVAGLMGRKAGRRPAAVVEAGKAAAQKKPGAAPMPQARASSADGTGAPPGPSTGMAVAVAEAIDLTVQRARKEKALASLAEIRLAKERGKLLDAAEVAKGRVQRVMFAKQRLLALAARAAPLCVGKDAGEVHAVLEREALAVLEELSRE